MIYLDTSALVKLVVREAETVGLQSWMKAQESGMFFASQLARVELVRAVIRSAPDRLDRAREALSGLTLLKIDDEIITLAEALSPATLRSLDAIHLATALSVASHLYAFVSYDVRLSDAATALGLSVVSP